MSRRQADIDKPEWKTTAQWYKDLVRRTRSPKDRERQLVSDTATSSWRQRLSRSTPLEPDQAASSQVRLASTRCRRQRTRQFGRLRVRRHRDCATTRTRVKAVSGRTGRRPRPSATRRLPRPHFDQNLVRGKQTQDYRSWLPLAKRSSTRRFRVAAGRATFASGGSDLKGQARATNSSATQAHGGS